MAKMKENNGEKQPFYVFLIFCCFEFDYFASLTLRPVPGISEWKVLKLKKRENSVIYL